MSSAGRNDQAAGKLAGRVAFISGAARGQGRAHAVRLAEEGADIIAFDLCEDLPSVSYSLGNAADLERTAELVRNVGARVIARRADVRDLDAMTGLAEEGYAAFGRIDIAVANAGINNYATTWTLSEEQWSDVLETNLTGVFNTMKAVLPPMIAGGRGGAIIVTASGAIYRGYNETAHYTSSKHAVVGLTRTLALEAAEYGIRVNALAPTGVNTPMITDDPTLPRRARPDLERPVLADMIPGMVAMNAVPVPWIEPEDVSEVVLWLVSDEARYITGQVVPIDAGLAIK